MKNQKNLKKGQMTVEMVLILSILIFLSYTVKRELFDKRENPFHQFITGPWKAVLVMMESGIWKTNPVTGRQNHPNHFNRMRSEKGTDPTK